MVESVDGDASDAEVVSVEVVVVEPGGQSCCSLHVGGEGAGVGPLGGEGEVESLDLPLIQGRCGRMNFWGMTCASSMTRNVRERR